MLHILDILDVFDIVDILSYYIVLGSMCPELEDRWRRDLIQVEGYWDKI